jgi:cyclic beta-1,2-glucan synthetase
LYGLEPYVMAADVYSAAPYAGRGGWSWYTGSAGVMLRAALEGLCGLEVQGTRLRLQPQLPPHWPGLSLRLVVGGRPWVLQLWRADAVHALRRARARGALPLRRGRWLDTAAPAATNEVLMLLPAPAQCGPPRPPPAAAGGQGLSDGAAACAPR